MRRKLQEQKDPSSGSNKNNVWEGENVDEDESKYRWCVWARYQYDNHWDSYPLFRTGDHTRARSFLDECREKEDSYYQRYLSSKEGRENEEVAGSWKFFISVMDRPCFVIYSRLVVDNRSRIDFPPREDRSDGILADLPSEFGEPYDKKIYSWHERNTVLRLVGTIGSKLQEDAKKYRDFLGFIPRVECYPNTIHLNDGRELVTLDELYGEEDLSDDTVEEEEDEMSEDEEYEDDESMEEGECDEEDDEQSDDY